MRLVASFTVEGQRWSRMYRGRDQGDCKGRNDRKSRQDVSRHIQAHLGTSRHIKAHPGTRFINNPYLTAYYVANKQANIWLGGCIRDDDDDDDDIYPNIDLYRIYNMTFAYTIYSVYLYTICLRNKVYSYTPMYIISYHNFT